MLFPFIGDYGFAEIERVVLDKWLTDLVVEKNLKQNTIHTIYYI